jgi:WD40 repeat protein
MKFVGSNWVSVGTAGFSAGQSQYTSLAFSPSGQPYVAYCDHTVSLKATVMKFDGTNWVYIGIQGFSEGEADYTSLAFNPSGQPYVAYTDYVSYNRGASVKKFDGTNWVYVGAMDFSNGSATYTSLAFSPSNGKPYVTYRDYGQTYKVTVMYFNAPVGINELMNAQLSIYPNPTSKSITLNFKSLSGNLTFIEIVDIKGTRMLETETMDSKIVVDVDNYSSGIYIVYVKSVSSNYFVKFCKD